MHCAGQADATARVGQTLTRPACSEAGPDEPVDWQRPISPATVLAPMAGVTDTVFRRFIRNLGGCGLIMTEFTSADGVLREQDQKAKRYLHFYEDEHPDLGAAFWQQSAGAGRSRAHGGGPRLRPGRSEPGLPGEESREVQRRLGPAARSAGDWQDFRGGARGGEDSVHGEVSRRMERRRNRLRRTGAHGGELAASARSRCTPARASKATAATRAGSGSRRSSRR